MIIRKTEGKAEFRGVNNNEKYYFTIKRDFISGLVNLDFTGEISFRNQDEIKLFLDTLTTLLINNIESVGI